VLEDGTAPDGANSYATETMADDYFDARGNTTWTDSTDDKEAALIRATAAIDAMYGSRFQGYRTNFRDQDLQWPRTGAYDNEGNIIAGNEIPQELIDATCEAAYRELTTAGSMMPDVERGGDIRALKAGSVAIEYGPGASAYTTFTLIDGILAPLLGAGNSDYSYRAVRG
jgi:hypothetical protein